MHAETWGAFYACRQNFGFEIMEVFCVKRKVFFHGGEKLAAISFVTVQEVGVSKSRFASSRSANFVQVDGNFHSNFMEQKKWSTSENHSFVPENFHLIYAYHLHFNR